MRALYHWLLQDAPMWFAQLLIFTMVFVGIVLLGLFIMIIVTLGILLFS